MGKNAGLAAPLVPTARAPGSEGAADPCLSQRGCPLQRLTCPFAFLEGEGSHTASGAACPGGTAQPQPGQEVVLGPDQGSGAGVNTPFPQLIGERAGGFPALCRGPEQPRGGRWGPGLGLAPPSDLTGRTTAGVASLPWK